MGEQNEIRVLNNVENQLKKGEVIAIAGGAGSGKSTLAHILVNILQGDGGNSSLRGKRFAAETQQL